MKRTRVEKHFDGVAKDYDFYKNKNSFYYQNLKELLGNLIPDGKKVFEIGCGTGDLLNYLNSQEGYGFDISSRMIGLAKKKYKQDLVARSPGKKTRKLYFSTVWPKETFDYVFMSDVIEHLEDPQKTFKQISGLMNKKSELVVTMANPIWEPVLMVAEKLKLKMPEGPHNRIGYQKLKIQMEEAGIKIVKHDYKLLVPVKIPGITNFANRYLEKPLKRFAFIEYFIAVLC